MKKLLLSFLILAALSNAGLGQDIDLVKKMKATIVNGEINDKIKAYNQLGWQYRKVYPDSSIYFLENALELLELTESKSLSPETYNYLGVAYTYKGNMLKSYDYHIHAKELATLNKDSLQYAHALNSLGRLYEGTAAYDKAIEYYNEALEVFKAIDDKIGLAYLYSSLATFYQSQKSFMKAEEMSKRALKIRMGEELWAGVAFSYLELAKIYNDAQKDDMAFETLTMAKQYSDSVRQNLVLKAEVNTEISSLSREKGDFEAAMKLMTVAENIAESISNQNLFMKVYNELGKLNYDVGNYSKAIQYHKKVISAAEQSAFWEELKDAYHQLALNYEKMGRINDAYNYFKKYNEIEIRFLDTEKARLVQQHESRIALENRAKENELLKIEKQKNEAQLAQQKTQSWALIGLAAVMFILMVTFIIYNYKRKRDNELLIQQKNQLSDINLQKDTLMNILAHDLKAPFNRIIGLCDLMKVDKGNEELYTDLIDKMGKSGIELIKDILDVSRLESREVKENIGPVDLNELFNDKIATYKEEAKAKNIALKTALDVDNYFLSNKLFLERIVDNLLSNAIKYSKENTEVSLAAEKNSAHLNLTVSDQGPGFTEEDKRNLYQKFKPLSAKPTAGEASNGLGLSLVKNLIDKLNGSIELNSELGKGSTFKVMIPEFN